MRLSPASTKYAFGIAIAALLAGCSGGAQFAPQNVAGASLHSRHVRPLSAHDTVLYAFTAGKSDGSYPYGSPVIDSKGALYGTSDNTPGGVGDVWKLTPSGSTYKESVLYTFPKDKSQGSFPVAGLVMDSSGALYGTASGGGKGTCPGTGGCGTVFKLTPSKGGYKESMLYDFGLKTNDGTIPDDALLLVGSELYGTTEYGGAGKCTLYGVNGCGTVFELSTKGSGYKTLYSFKGGKDGNYPQASVVADKSGVLFGVTNNGGGGTKNCPAGCGIVFSLTTGGKETVLHTFAGGSADGGIPGRGRGLYVGSSGTPIVGTTTVEGSGGCGLGFLGGCGVVFELQKSGKTYKESVVYTFQGGSNDMQAPNEELVADASGNLYGTAFLAGGGGCQLGCGGIFELQASGSTYTEGVAYQFQGGKDGAIPYDGVAMDKSGNLFGTTNLGGGSTNCSNGCGTVYELTP